MVMIKVGFWLYVKKQVNNLVVVVHSCRNPQTMTKKIIIIKNRR